MLESIRHLRDFTESGIPSQFLLFSLYTWIIMLPRSIFAGIFYCSQPGFNIKPIQKYTYTLITSAIIAAITITYNRLSGEPIYWFEYIAVLISTLLLAIASLPLASRSLIKGLFAWTPYFHHLKILNILLS